MNIIVKFFKTRGVGYYLTIPGLVLGIVALIMYNQTGVTSFSPALNQNAIICLSVGISLCALSLIADFKEIKYIAAIIFLYSFMWYLYSQVTYITNVFVAIDGNTFTADFIVTFLSFILAFVVTLLAGILTRWHPLSKAKPAGEEV